jgi:hypothetical protein
VNVVRQRRRILGNTSSSAPNSTDRPPTVAHTAVRDPVTGRDPPPPVTTTAVGDVGVTTGVVGTGAGDDGPTVAVGGAVGEAVVLVGDAVGDAVGLPVGVGDDVFDGVHVGVGCCTVGLHVGCPFPWTSSPGWVEHGWSPFDGPSLPPPAYAVPANRTAATPTAANTDAIMMRGLTV